MANPNKRDSLVNVIFASVLDYNEKLCYKVCIQVLRAQLELGQVRQEIDRKIAEKEEEFLNTR